MQTPAILARAALSALAIASTLADAHAQGATQSWDYRSYKKGRYGEDFAKDKFVDGTLTLTEKDGRSYITVSSGPNDVCYRGDIPATVTRTDTLTTIDVAVVVTGCEHYRYVIRNDGSGGNKETLRGERWAGDRYDHKLTAVK